MSDNVISLTAFKNARRAAPPAVAVVPELSDERPAKRRNKVLGVDYVAHEGTLSHSPRAIQQARWTEYTRFNPGPHYRLLARKFDWDFATDEYGYHWFGDCQEVHDEVVEYFAVFGLSYEDYATIPAEEFNDAFNMLYWRAAFFVLDYIENPAHFEQVTAYLPTHSRTWLKAVAVGKSEPAKANKALAAVVKAKSPKQERVLLANYGYACREWGFRRFDCRRYWYPEKYLFKPFQADEHGRFHIADSKEHASFCGHASAFGYEYRNIATDKELLDTIANVLIGSVGQEVWRFIGRRWSKPAAEKLFAGCSPNVIRYVSAVHGCRLDTVWKLRDEVFPELQAWAKKHQARKGKITAWGRMD